MKTVKITEILDYYDGILAFTAQDPIGGHYVGSIIERTSEKRPLPDRRRQTRTSRRPAKRQG